MGHTISHKIALLSIKICHFVSIGAESPECNNLECIFAVLLNRNEFKYDTNNVFKYFSNENSGNDNCNAYYCESVGMFVFDCLVMKCECYSLLCVFQEYK